MSVIEVRVIDHTMSRCHVHGPTFHLAWNAAAPAMVHIARKLKNTCEMWKTMAGFETII